jgi:hypothetical protein
MDPLDCCFRFAFAIAFHLISLVVAAAYVDDVKKFCTTMMKAKSFRFYVRLHSSPQSSFSSQMA